VQQDLEWESHEHTPDGYTKQKKRRRKKKSWQDWVFQILGIIGKVAIGIAVTYAFVFSITCTIILYVAYKNIKRPFTDVQYLTQHNPKETIFMKRYCLDQKKKGAPPTFSQIFVPLDSISKNLKSAVLAAEDDGFYTHPGFDIAAILDAYQYNKVHNRNARGASTITQQLAKNLFLSDEKSFIRKFRELGYTLLMEKTLGKDRILELYLNYAQWGDSLFGCEAASQYYFKKPSSRLTLAESMRMAATLASPERLNPKAVKSVFLQKRIEVIANNMYLKHLIDDSAYSTMCGKAPPQDTLAEGDTLNVEKFDKMKAAARASIAAKFFSAPAPQKQSPSAKRGHRF
jgi:monofunctional biosynthetic peptidoglycan transglycosylase